MVKGFDGAVELLLGAIIAIVGSYTLYTWAIDITTPELLSEPDSLTAYVVQHDLDNIANASTGFAEIYLIIHGVLKLTIVIALLREQKWIFPVAAVILSGFIAYMIYRLAHHWSGWLCGFALFDLLTLALVVNEWRGSSRNH